MNEEDAPKTDSEFALRSLIERFNDLEDDNLASDDQRLRLSGIAFKIMNLQQQISRLTRLVFSHPYSDRREQIAYELDDQVDQLVRLYDTAQKSAKENNFQRTAKLTEFQREILKVIGMVADDIKRLLDEYIAARGR